MSQEIISNILAKNYVQVQEVIYDKLAEKANEKMDQFKEKIGANYFGQNVSEEIVSED